MSTRSVAVMCILEPLRYIRVRAGRAGLLVIIGIALYLASWVPHNRDVSHAIALASNLTFGLGIA